MFRFSFAAALFVCASVLAVSTQGSHAQPAATTIAKPKNAEALDRLAKGNKLYNVRSFAEAAEEYKAGALIETAPIFDYNLGQCYRQLGRYEDAIWHYQRFIKSSQQVTQHVDAANQFVKQMQDELSKKAMTAPPTEAAPTSAQPASPTQPIQPEQPPVDRAVSDEQPAWYHDRLGLVLGIGGIAAAGIGTGLLISGRSLYDEGNTSKSQRERDTLFDRAETRSTIGVVTTVAGGALLVTGIVLLAIPDGRGEPPSVALSIQPNGVSFYGRF